MRDAAAGDGQVRPARFYVVRFKVRAMAQSVDVLIRRDAIKLASRYICLLMYRYMRV